MLKNTPVAANLPAADVERAKNFYSEKLGLRPVDIAEPNAVALKGGDNTMLFLYEREGGSRADHTAARWLVEDIEKSVADLRENGVEFEQYDMPNLKTNKRGIAEAGGVKGAWFKDTEGNILAIAEMPD